MATAVPAALYAKDVRLWSKEEKRAHLDEYIRQLVEARDTIKQLIASPEFHTPEVQAQINALADKFHMREEQAQPAVP
jgi:transcriptional accessory protein Tex/SPT6